MRTVTSADTRAGVANGETRARNFTESSQEEIIPVLAGIGNLTTTIRGQVQPAVEKARSIVRGMPEADDVRLPPAEAPTGAPDGSDPTPTSLEEKSRTPLSMAIAAGSALLNPGAQVDENSVLGAAGEYAMDNYVTPTLTTQMTPFFDQLTTASAAQQTATSIACYFTQKC
jgi:hypothetical protein